MYAARNYRLKYSANTCWSCKRKLVYVSLEEEIEVLRELLNDVLKNEEQLTETNVVRLSQKLDKLIEKYYAKQMKIIF